MKLMLRLEYLSVSQYALAAADHSILLKHCTFPRLLSCAISAPNPFNHLPLSAEILASTTSLDLLASFLGRHQTLKRLRVPSNGRIVTSPSVYISLPNLQYYEGAAALIPLMNGGGLLRDVRLIWHDSDRADIEKIMKQLKSMTSPDRPPIYCHRYLEDCYMPIITSIYETMPHTKTLQMQSLTVFFELLDEVSLQHNILFTR